MSLQSSFAATADQIQRQVEVVFTNLETAARPPADRIVVIGRDLSLRSVQQWRELNENALGLIDQVAEFVRDTTRRALRRGDAAMAPTADAVKDAAQKVADKAVDAGVDVAAKAIEVVEAVKSEVVDLTESATAAVAPATKAALNKLTKAQLLELAAAKDVDGRAAMTKAQLVDALVG